MAAPMAELPVEPQSLRKLSLKLLKRGLDVFSPLMALPSLSTHKAIGFESAIRELAMPSKSSAVISVPGSSYRFGSSSALIERIPSKWPKPVWHPSWENY